MDEQNKPDKNGANGKPGEVAEVEKDKEVDYVAELAKAKAEKAAAQAAAKAELATIKSELEQLGKGGVEAERYDRSNADDSKPKPEPLTEWPERLVAQYKEKGEELPPMDEVLIGG